MSMVRTAGTAGLRESMVELPCRTLHAVQSGTGRPIVMIHGYTDSWYSFRQVIPLLSVHGHCLAYDQRGHGATIYDGDDFEMDAYASDTAGLIVRLNLGPATLVGHSMGSLVARRVALNHPELVERLVLVGAPYRIDTPAVLELAEEVARLGDSVPRGFVESFQASCVADHGSVPTWFFETCVDASAGVSPSVWRAALKGMLADDTTDRLKEIQCQALVIGGQEDTVFTPGDHSRLASAMPHGRLLLYEGVGHSPHWERPERFARDVAEFLARTA